ncbi:uncharacterized protein EI90DRAFT_3117249 [Cantharellus anzutake]|uniref:uncharacterized protein n=1 Tax=Cantharellus anzutake TaxID=1750568 RepID=UPI001907AED6|nr:uncharacterized protein EI90DRAFT_3117249 [Cantharellus anzutake]KAF8340714.1 hypothetical protein EI90DRAFT_3117249 [Cantharellus anzutake]
MGKAKPTSAAPKSARPVARKSVPTPPAQNITSADLIRDNLLAKSTQKSYASAVSGVQEWLKETMEEYTARRGNDISACLVPLFCHPLAVVSFAKPTEVTVPLLSEYITHLVTVQKRSSSLVGVTYSAFKRHFTSQGKSGYWKPSPIPDECEGNPCEAQVIHDLVNAIKNKHKVEGRVHNHARAIWIEDIKKLQGVTASRVPVVLFQRALTTVDSLDVAQRDAVRDHLMFSAISSLGWALWTRNEELTSIQIQHLDWYHQEAHHDLPHLQVTLENRKGWQKRLDSGSSGNTTCGHAYNLYPFPFDDYGTFRDPHKMPEVDAYRHVCNWITFLQLQYHGGKVLAPNFPLFPSFNLHNIRWGSTFSTASVCQKPGSKGVNAELKLLREPSSAGWYKRL